MYPIQYIDMGNYANKFLLTNEGRKESNEPQQGVTQDNSTCTPTLEKKKILVDPRSVSAGITRTPIEVKCTPVGVTKGAINAIPKYLQKKQYLETDIDVVMPPLTPKKQIPKAISSEGLSGSDELQDYLASRTNIIKNKKTITQIDKERYAVLGLDPRSPAADFDRTPILLPRSLALIRARSQENLSRRGSYETDVYNAKNSCRDVSISLGIPEIKMSPNVVSEDAKTNIEKSNELCTPNTPQSDSDLSVFKSEEEITIIKNSKYKHEEVKPSISDEQIVAADKREDKNSTGDLDNCENIEHSVKTMRIKDDNEIEIWQDSLSIEENSSGKKDKKKIVLEKVPREDVIITFDEHTTTSLKSIKTEENCQKKEDREVRKNTKTDSKLVLNEKKVFSPKNKHGTEMCKNRTPLSNRSNKDQVQERPSNSPQQLSRNKTMSSRLQQENTPPYKAYKLEMELAKTRNGIQWDSNSTVFI